MNNDEQQAKIDALKKSLAKTIDDFKETVIGGIASTQAHAPEGATKERVMVVKPLEGDVTGIVPRAKVQEWVEEQEKIKHDEAPYADVSDKSDFVLRARNVHAFCSGIDNQVNSTVRFFLQKMGVRTHVPMSKGIGRYSIIEQFNADKDFNFAIVILSPDAYVLNKTQSVEGALLVTDQATVFELGFLIGKLGRNRVVVLYEANDRFKRPTEYFDVLYTEFDASGLWQEKILRQMRASGLEIHEEQIVSA